MNGTSPKRVGRACRRGPAALDLLNWARVLEHKPQWKCGPKESGRSKFPTLGPVFDHYSSRDAVTDGQLSPGLSTGSKTLLPDTINNVWEQLPSRRASCI
jgi:hypothetical protein